MTAVTVPESAGSEVDCEVYAQLHIGNVGNIRCVYSYALRDSRSGIAVKQSGAGREGFTVVYSPGSDAESIMETAEDQISEQLGPVGHTVIVWL